MVGTGHEKAGRQGKERQGNRWGPDGDKGGYVLGGGDDRRSTQLWLPIGWP